MTDLADLSLVEAADAVRNGDATSMELLDACWRNMETANRGRWGAEIAEMIDGLDAILTRAGAARRVAQSQHA